MEQSIELGDRVEDKITKFKGIVIGITDWLYGCRRIAIQPETINKTTGEAGLPQTFDEPQLKVIKRGVIKPVTVDTKPTGGPRPDATRRPDPRR